MVKIKEGKGFFNMWFDFLHGSDPENGEESWKSEKKAENGLILFRSVFYSIHPSRPIRMNRMPSRMPAGSCVIFFGHTAISVCIRIRSSKSCFKSAQKIRIGRYKIGLMSHEFSGNRWVSARTARI